MLDNPRWVLLHVRRGGEHARGAAGPWGPAGSALCARPCAGGPCRRAEQRCSVLRGVVVCIVQKYCVTKLLKKGTFSGFFATGGNVRLSEL